VLPVPP